MQERKYHPSIATIAMIHCISHAFVHIRRMHVYHVTSCLFENYVFRASLYLCIIAIGVGTAVHGAESTIIFKASLKLVLKSFLQLLKLTCRHYRSDNAISMAKKRCTLSATHAINCIILILIGQTASYLIILCSF